MRTRLFTTALFPLLALLAFGSARVPVAATPVAETESSAPAQLEAQSGVADSAPLHTLGELFTGGTVVETPRRLHRVRLHLAAKLLVHVLADESKRAALLRLRAAERDQREIGDTLERYAAGTTSYHTTTPPPRTHA